MGYRAAKFGWGPIGMRGVQDDADQFMAAREGLGDDVILLIDAGTVWKEDLAAALLRVPALKACRATWFEEPFVSGALKEYAALAAACGEVKLAGGEGSHNFHMAQQMIDYAGIGYVQIDAGRIGGISVSRAVAEYAGHHGVTYVNHTFTSHLALSASLQPYAGVEADVICEYPVELKQLAEDITVDHVARDANGQVFAPARPGLGLEVNRAGLRPYVVDTEIKVKGQVIYRTPEL
jgi:L-alanine-DL-glutamate epimerase-like enolase superfamily enzyme